LWSFVGESNVSDLTEPAGIVFRVKRVELYPGEKEQSVGGGADGVGSANAGNLGILENLGVLDVVRVVDEPMRLTDKEKFRSLLLGLPGVVWDVDARTVVGQGKKHWPRWESPRVGEDVVGDEGRDWVYDYSKPLEEAYEKLVRVGRTVPGVRW